MRTRFLAFLLTLSAAALLLAAAGCSTAPDPNAAKQSLKDLQTQGRIDEVSETNFVYSAEMSDLQAVDLYLASGMNPDVKNEQGNTPLMAAAAAEEESPLYHRNPDVVNHLLEARADVNVRNTEGESPLAIAMRLGRVNVAKALEEAGAKP